MGSGSPAAPRKDSAREPPHPGAPFAGDAGAQAGRPEDACPWRARSARPSARSRSEAASRRACSSRKKASRARPGAIGSRISSTDRAGPAQEAAARPVEAGIEGDRQAGHAEGLVEMGDAELVGGRRAGGRRVPSGKIMIWRPPCASSRARAFISTSARDPALRSTGTQPRLGENTSRRAGSTSARA